LQAPQQEASQMHRQVNVARDRQQGVCAFPDLVRAVLTLARPIPIDRFDPREQKQGKW
jgi:hypothetical protein